MLRPGNWRKCFPSIDGISRKGFHRVSLNKKAPKRLQRRGILRGRGVGGTKHSRCYLLLLRSFWECSRPRTCRRAPLESTGTPGRVGVDRALWETSLPPSLSPPPHIWADTARVIYTQWGDPNSKSGLGPARSPLAPSTRTVCVPALCRAPSSAVGASLRIFSPIRLWPGSLTGRRSEVQGGRRTWRKPFG